MIIQSSIFTKDEDVWSVLYSQFVPISFLFSQVQPNDITQLEQRFWQLKEESGRIDRVIFKARVCGNLFPDHIFEGVFRAFDVNNDGQIDFKEMTCGVSACCRGPVAEIEKCKFGRKIRTGFRFQFIKTLWLNSFLSFHFLKKFLQSCYFRDYLGITISAIMQAYNIAYMFLKLVNLNKHVCI